MQPADGINREAIDSSNLVSIGYSDERQVLAVEFKPRAGEQLGLILHYEGVSVSQAFDFYAAPSRGKHYSEHIRGKFKAQTMTGPCSSCRHNGIVGLACDCGGQHYRLERRAEPDRETVHPSEMDQVRR